MAFAAKEQSFNFHWSVWIEYHASVKAQVERSLPMLAQQWPLGKLRKKVVS